MTSHSSQQIYQELESRLQSSSFAGAASEVQGILTGLACRGVKATQLEEKLPALGLAGKDIHDIIFSLFDMVLASFADHSFEFATLLPDETEPQFDRGEAISNWCQGFLQGYHNPNPLPTLAPRDQEVLDTILVATHLQIDNRDDVDDNEITLHEITDTIRVSIKLLYESLNKQHGQHVN